MSKFENSDNLDLVQMYISCKAPQKNEQQTKADFCRLFLSKLKKMRDEDLAPHLADVTFDKRERRTYIRLWF